MSTKVGRNDLCPCGSGKKYKKCCLSKYDRHGYHELLCYLDSIKDLSVCDETWPAKNAAIKLLERGTGRAVYIHGIDWCEMGRVRRVRDALLARSDFYEEVLKPDGALCFEVWGQIPTWNASTIVMDWSHTIRNIQLVRIRSKENEGGESNGAT